MCRYATELLDENDSWYDIQLLRKPTDLPNKNGYCYNILLPTMPNGLLNEKDSLYDITVLRKLIYLPIDNGSCHYTQLLTIPTELV